MSFNSDRPLDAPPKQVVLHGDLVANLPTLPIRKLIIVGMLIPAVVAMSNMFLVNHGAKLGLRDFFYPWLTFSIAVLGWNAGRHVQPTWLSWIVFGWSLLVLDLMTVLARVTSVIDVDIGYVLAATQIGLLVMWIILGPGNWQVRLPVVALLAPAIVILLNNLDRSRSFVNWNSILMLTGGVMLALAGGLRYFGFALQMFESNAQPTANASGSKTIQFGMKHMLIWLSVAGPLLLVLRSLNLSSDTTFPAVLVAVSVATVNLISIWSVLGGGRGWLRIIFLIVIPLLIAGGLAYYSSDLRMRAPANLFSARPRTPPAIIGMIQMQERWLIWFGLETALLAALLLYFRARGFRLLRTLPRITNKSREAA